MHNVWKVIMSNYIALNMIQLEIWCKSSRAVPNDPLKVAIFQKKSIQIGHYKATPTFWNFEILDFRRLLYWYQRYPKRFGKKKFKTKYLAPWMSGQTYFLTYSRPRYGPRPYFEIVIFSKMQDIFVYFQNMYRYEIKICFTWRYKQMCFHFFHLRGFSEFLPLTLMHLKSWWEFFFQLFLTFSAFILC